MPVPQVLLESVGHWKGSSTLHLKWSEDNVQITDGPSTLRVASFNDQYAVVDYEWEYEGKTERGTLIAATGKKGTTFGWSDSWHQNSEVMLLTGEGADCKGTYQVEGYPAWGWRIAFSADVACLKMEMFNISPDGEEEWAVRAVYDRA